MASRDRDQDDAPLNKKPEVFFFALIHDAGTHTLAHTLMHVPGLDSGISFFGAATKSFLFLCFGFWAIFNGVSLGEGGVRFGWIG